MVLRLFLMYIFLYSACYAEKSVKEVQAYNMIEKAKAENVIQAGLINAIYFLNTEYFVLEGENRKIRNPLYSPEQARDYVNLLIRTLNLSRVDVLAKMIDEIHMVEIKFNILEEDMDRLWTLKEKRGENSMTGNQFAKELLVETLHRLQPRIPKDDE